VFTLVILTVRTWRALGKRGSGLEPAALGLTFVRGER
jgi:hypothetical protein